MSDGQNSSADRTAEPPAQGVLPAAATPPGPGETGAEPTDSGAGPVATSAAAASGSPQPVGSPGSAALYRRYRPQTFEDVIGQEHVTGPLLQALRSGRVGHAYLFSGPRGCGKTTSARILARCLNCAEGPTPTPCGHCPSCEALARGGAGSVDVIEIDAASHGGVDDARDLREKASYGPAQSRFKVYIIDEAHMVTPQGFNALLKIVEEPPEHVKFVFATTEPEKVIGTIRSRTHHYPFRLVPPSRLQDYLAQLCQAEGITVEPGVLSFVIRAGGGSVRDSLSVLDQLMAGSVDEKITYAGAAALLGFTESELLDATVDALAAGDGAAVFAQIDRTIETGQDPRRFVEDLLERVRDLIVIAAVGASGGDVPALFPGTPGDQLERMRSQAGAFGLGELSHAADVVNAGLTEMTGATSPRLQLELICARLLLPGVAGEHGLVARVDRLERRLEHPDQAPPRPTGRAALRRESPAVSGPAPDAGAQLADAAPASQMPPGASPAAAAPAPPAPSTDGPGTPGPTAGGPSAGGSPQQRGAAHAAPSAPAPAADRGPAPSRTAAGPGAPGASTAPAPAPVPRPTPPPGGGFASPTGAPASVPAGAAGPRAASGTGPRTGLDVEAIRRRWPDVLAKVFAIRRVTWTFLSAHAEVLDFDGQRLLLGISTRGLTATFRGGQHAEVVRQALIDALGLDARVEAMPQEDARRANLSAAGQPATPAAPAGSPSPGPAGQPSGPPPGQPPPGPPPGPPSGRPPAGHPLTGPPASVPSTGAAHGPSETGTDRAARPGGAPSPAQGGHREAATPPSADKPGSVPSPAPETPRTASQATASATPRPETRPDARPAPASASQSGPGRPAPSPAAPTGGPTTGRSGPGPAAASDASAPPTWAQIEPPDEDPGWGPESDQPDPLAGPSAAGRTGGRGRRADTSPAAAGRGGAAPATESRPARPTPIPGRGRAAFRAALAEQASRSPRGPGPARGGAEAAPPAASADSGSTEVSDDDENIDDLRHVGQPVIASVLGGVVIEEFET